MARIKQIIRKGINTLLNPFGFELNRKASVRTNTPSEPQLNRTQTLFCEWNAERLGITPAESRERYLQSWQSVAGGHGDQTYRDFCVTAHQLFRVFFEDHEREVRRAYEFHGHMHLLRMLSYHEPSWPDDHPVVQGLQPLSLVSILDFGCGLAQESRMLAQHLQSQGKSVKLYLADIPTVRSDFLVWLCQKTQMDATFLACTDQTPIPQLPPVHVCISTEFFEHAHDPVSYFTQIHEALLPEGFLVTGVTDHPPEYMHVTPSLSLLREEIRRQSYEELLQYQIFRKKAPHLSASGTCG